MRGLLYPVLIWWIVLPACRRTAPEASAPSAPGAAVAAAHEPTIRVRLRASVPSVTVQSEGSCRVRDAGGGAVNEASVQSVVVSVGGADGFGQTRLLINGESFNTPSVSIEPVDACLIAVRMPQQDHADAYRGTIVCSVGDDGLLTVVNELPVERYLPQVVAGEMPDSFAVAALRAQAIAARTYALYEMATAGRSRPWDVTDDEASQVYRPASMVGDHPRALAAVEYTRGLVAAEATPGGPKIFPTFYHSTCGGRTLPAEAIANVADDEVLAGNVACSYCRASPYYRWSQRSMHRTELERRLREHLSLPADFGRLASIGVIKRSALGRPMWLALVDDRGVSVAERAETVRLAIDPAGRWLPSMDCRLSSAGDVVVFSQGSGFGHGVGLCQWGAQGMAQADHDAAGILRFYYPGCRLVRAYE